MGEQDSGQKVRVQWEYHSYVAEIVDGRLTYNLREYGREGWELVQCIDKSEVNFLLFIFKRPKG